MHKPVLLKEVINFLNIKDDGIYVDCTLGHGGHSLEILKRLNGRGKLIGIERDESALKIAKDRLKQFSNCYLFHSNYLDLKDLLKTLNISKITGGVLLDLGINSMQLDDPSRGFSIKNDAPLDMRMDQNQTLTAYKIVNSYKENELADIIYKYGEERYSRKIARLVAQKRDKNGPLKTTSDLANLVLHCYPRNKHFKTHPATRTFQALRIEVNKELENIEKFLCFIPELLLPPCRLTVISFHSLEDRITKNFLKNNSNFKILTKKPVVPSESETEINPRARSAKLRAAERIQSEEVSKFLQ
ncbi:MAG: 16S rRNA (cytosine(1402)-N(4))-methyltransferase RsmH [Candidatus Melainabacteria bacterium]|nr:16S rRNA (cytosine(1402)-N(4))-methyltransferase RsmH [Candidatus Melainabacteria bacterium]